MHEPDDRDPHSAPGGEAPAVRPHGDPLAGEVPGSARPAGMEPSAALAALGEEAAAGALEHDQPPLPSRGLLSFYDRLRATITQAVERRGFRLGRQVVEALLLVPDMFILLVRLALDREVPASSRALFGGAIAYFILPVDLLPEAALGVAGYLDDLILAAVVLSHAMSPELEPQARRYWSGSHDLRRTLADLLGAGRTLLGANLYARLEALLARRGISMAAAERKALNDAP